jgi:hypothetical protein
MSNKVEFPTIHPNQVQVDTPDQSNELLQTIDLIIAELKQNANPNIPEQPYTFQQTMKTQFESFAEQYPTLFQLMCRDPFHFERDRLIQMLQMRNRVYKKELSYDQASKKVGKQYYEEFVKPTIPEEKQPSEEQLQNIMEKSSPEEQRRQIQQLIRSSESKNSNESFHIREKK